MDSIRAFITSKGYDFEPEFLDGVGHYVTTDKFKGWYIGSVFEDGSATFTFRSWNNPENFYFSDQVGSSGKKPDTKTLKKEAEEKRHAEHLMAKSHVEKILRKLEDAQPMPPNQYWRDKKLPPKFPGIIFRAGEMGTQTICQIPVQDLNGEVWNLQTIGDGKGAAKLFRKGARLKGLFFPCGSVPQIGGDVIYVGEGVATCLSLHMMTGNTVLAAFSVGNIKNVCNELLSAGYEKKQILVAADFDGGGAVNAGMYSAQEIYKKLGIECVFPKCDVNEKCDFSDVYLKNGAGRPAFVEISEYGGEDFFKTSDFTPKKEPIVRTEGEAPCEAKVETMAEPPCFNTTDEDFSKIKRTTLQDNFVPQPISTANTGFHFKIPKAKPPGTFDLVTDFEGLVSELNNLYRYRVLEGTDMCFTWNGKIYKQIIKSRIKEFAHQKFFPKPMTAKVTEFVERVMRTKQESVGFFSPMRKINFQNGWLDLDKWEFFNHTDEIGFRNILGYDFMPEAVCPNFDLFLNKITCGDSGLQDLLLQFIGYAVSGDNCWAQKALVLTGSGSNGKSTFLNIMRALLGEENVAPLTLSDMRSEYKLQMLDGKLANMAEETPQRSLMESSLFKNIVGGGTVVLRQIYDTPYQTKLITKLVFACNEMPGSYDTTKAFFRRFIIVPFNAVFDDSQADFDPFIEAKLKGELPGIMNKVLKAYLVLKKNKRFARVEASDETLEEYRTSVDPVRLWVKEEVEVDGACQEAVKSATLFREFRRWCDENGYKAGESCPFFKKFSTITGKKSETIKFKPKPAKGYKSVKIGTVQNEIDF